MRPAKEWYNSSSPYISGKHIIMLPLMLYCWYIQINCTFVNTLLVFN